MQQSFWQPLCLKTRQSRFLASTLCWERDGGVTGEPPGAQSQLLKKGNDRARDGESEATWLLTLTHHTSSCRLLVFPPRPSIHELRLDARCLPDSDGRKFFLFFLFVRRSCSSNLCSDFFFARLPLFSEFREHLERTRRLLAAARVKPPLEALSKHQLSLFLTAVNFPFCSSCLFFVTRRAAASKCRAFLYEMIRNRLHSRQTQVVVNQPVQIFQCRFLIYKLR